MAQYSQRPTVKAKPTNINFWQTIRSKESRGLLTSLVGSFALFIIQLIAYFYSHVLILLAGAYDTLSDTLISLLLLISIFWSRKPADEYHMFGHGRAQNISALITATIFIFFLSLETTRSSIDKFSHPEQIQNLNLAYLLTGVAIVFYLIPLFSLLKVKDKGPSVKTQFYALLEMEVAFIASLIGLFFISQGYLSADAYVSLFIGLVIALTGIKLLRENVDFLIGRSPSKEYLDTLLLTAKSVKGVIKVSDIKAEYVGPNIIHSGFTITVANGTPIEKANLIAEEVRKRIHRQTDCQYCVIHVDPERAI